MYGKGSLTAYEDRKFLFINNLHDERSDIGEDIAVFFVPRSNYLAFFGKQERPGIIVVRAVLTAND